MVGFWALDTSQEPSPRDGKCVAFQASEPPCCCTSVAPIIVAAERRYSLIRLILEVGVKEMEGVSSL